MNPVSVWSDQLMAPGLGTLRVWVTANGVRRIDFHSQSHQVRADEALSTDPAPPHLAAALTQLGEYLAGARRTFDLPLDLSPATPFQLRVYERLLRIPHGRVVTYGALARDIGEDASKARAVGQAVGANPIAVVVPCHRVVASDGRLVGFSGGIDRKAALLRLEGIHVDGSRPSSRVHPEVLRLPI